MKTNEYKFFQYPRGTNKGGVLDVEICPTISCSSWQNNCFLIEIYGCCWNTTEKFWRGELGGGIARIVKCDNSLATVVIEQTIEPKIIKEGNYSPSGHNASSIVNTNGISPTVMENHGTVTAIVEPETQELTPKRTEFGKEVRQQYENGELNMSRHTMQQLETHTDGVNNTFGATGVADSRYRIRKLTPRECFRLMGVDDADIDKIQLYPFGTDIEHPAYSYEERLANMSEDEKRKLMRQGISNSQQYKLAGNSIVFDVLYHLFRKMFVETENENEQLTLF